MLLESSWPGKRWKSDTLMNLNYVDLMDFWFETWQLWSYKTYNKLIAPVIPVREHRDKNNPKDLQEIFIPRSNHWSNIFLGRGPIRWLDKQVNFCILQSYFIIDLLLGNELAKWSSQTWCLGSSNKKTYVGRAIKSSCHIQLSSCNSYHELQEENFVKTRSECGPTSDISNSMKSSSVMHKLALVWKTARIKKNRVQI